MGWDRERERELNVELFLIASVAQTGKSNSISRNFLANDNIVSESVLSCKVDRY